LNPLTNQKILAKNLKAGEKIQKIKNINQKMYNIVLDEHLFVKANNLFCETLHPTNPWAQLYLCGAIAKNILIRLILQ